MTTFRKECFDLLTPPQGLNVYVRTEYVPAWCTMIHPLEFDMQLDYVQKKCFDFIRGLRVYVWTEYVLELCSFALCFIPFNLICNMTTSSKNALSYLPHPRVRGVCKD